MLLLEKMSPVITVLNKMFVTYFISVKIYSIFHLANFVFLEESVTVKKKKINV